MHWLSYFFMSRVEKRSLLMEERFFIVGVLVTFFFGVGLFLQNHYSFHYPINTIYLEHAVFGLCGCLFIFYSLSSVGVSARYADTVWLVKAIMMFFSVIFLKIFFDFILTTTPFELRDTQWVAFARGLHFHELTLLTFMHNQLPVIGQQTIWAIYWSLLFAVQGMVLYLAVFRESRLLYRFMIAFIFSTLLASLISYFLPTSSSPAGFYPALYFTKMQLSAVQAYAAVRAHIGTSVDFTGTLVAFPSYHAIWVVFLVYFFWDKPILRLPLLIYALLVLMSLMLTGWHYLADVVGGVMVGMCSLWLANKSLDRVWA